MSSLRDKTAVITGGGGVLCGTMARGLAEQGVKIAILNRTLEKGERVAEQIRSKGGQAIALSCNVLCTDDIIKAKDAVEREFGPCDILINGAGGNDARAATAREVWEEADVQGLAGSFFTMQEEGFRSVFDLNFLGTFLPTQIFARDMAGRPGATIINVSSMGAFSPMTKGVAYCAAKAAINNFTQWMAVHFAPAGIRVNAIAPGFFSTTQNRDLLWNKDGTATGRTAKILEHTPMKRLGEPEDLIGPTVWLCDQDASGFVTGTVIPVDGGFMAYSGV